MGQRMIERKAWMDRSFSVLSAASICICIMIFDMSGCLFPSQLDCATCQHLRAGVSRGM